MPRLAQPRVEREQRAHHHPLHQEQGDDGAQQRPAHIAGHTPAAPHRARGALVRLRHDHRYHHDQPCLHEQAGQHEHPQAKPHGDRDQQVRQHEPPDPAQRQPQRVGNARPVGRQQQGGDRCQPDDPDQVRRDIPEGVALPPNRNGVEPRLHRLFIAALARQRRQGIAQQLHREGGQEDQRAGQTHDEIGLAPEDAPGVCQQPHEGRVHASPRASRAAR